MQSLDAAVNMVNCPEAVAYDLHIHGATLGSQTANVYIFDSLLKVGKCIFRLPTLNCIDRTEDHDGSAWIQ